MKETRMTHQTQSNELDAIVQLLAEEGFDGMAQAIEILMNEAMKLERSEALRPDPTNAPASGAATPTASSPRPSRAAWDARTGRPADPRRRVLSPVLERGERSERALKLAVAEMYVQGVSTRKVAEITRELCGLEVSSSQVSRAAALLDEELEAWRNRPLGATPYLILDARYEKVRHGGASSIARCCSPSASRPREEDPFSA